jgi:putative transposase
MPRHTKFWPAGFLVHIIQRGNNRQACFAYDEDIAAYAHWLSLGTIKYGIAIHAWLFMTNHTHLLLTASNDGGISKLMQYIGRVHFGRFNYRYARTGTLFGGRYKSSLVQGNQNLLNSVRYIELDPMRAGTVRDPGHYNWSIYKSRAFRKQMSM